MGASGDKRKTPSPYSQQASIWILEEGVRPLFSAMIRSRAQWGWE